MAEVRGATRVAMPPAVGKRGLLSHNITAVQRIQPLPRRGAHPRKKPQEAVAHSLCSDQGYTARQPLYPHQNLLFSAMLRDACRSTAQKTYPDTLPRSVSLFRIVLDKDNFLPKLKDGP